MQRRDFMKRTLVLAAATAVPTSLSQAAESTDKAMIRKYTSVGKTGMKISDISFGAGKLPSASMVLRAIDRGMNYFDTAPDYGQSETLIGEALQKFKQRDKIYIASKFCNPIAYTEGKSHLQKGSTKADYIAAVEGSLQRLGTDYLDVVFVHAMGEKADYEAEKQRLLDETMLEAYAALKKAGKVRALAVSSHGPHNMEKLLTDAVASGHFDLLMPAFNFMKFPALASVLDAAQAKGVGVIAMKTLAGARDGGLDAGAGVFEQAAFKWVMKHPQVSGLVVTIKSINDLDNYLPASGQPFTVADQRALDQYAALHGADYCRTGCGDCEAACGQGVPVATILRYQMYFENYGDEKQAMQSYAALEKNAAACGTTCDSATCNGACPFGLPVGSKLEAAHRTLSMTV